MKRAVAKNSQRVETFPAYRRWQLHNRHPGAGPTTVPVLQSAPENVCRSAPPKSRSP